MKSVFMKGFVLFHIDLSICFVLSSWRFGFHIKQSSLSNFHLKYFFAEECQHHAGDGTSLFLPSIYFDMLHFKIWLISYLFYFHMNCFVRVKLAMTDHTLTVCDFSCRFLTKRWQNHTVMVCLFHLNIYFCWGFTWNNAKVMSFYLFSIWKVCVWVTKWWSSQWTLCDLHVDVFN